MGKHAKWTAGVAWHQYVAKSANGTRDRLNRDSHICRGTGAPAGRVLDSHSEAERRLARRGECHAAVPKVPSRKADALRTNLAPRPASVA